MQSPTETKLYLLDLRPFFSHNCWVLFLPALTPERAGRARVCRKEADAARIAGAGWLLDFALTKENIPPSSRVFSKNEWGKPFLKDLPLAFSLSHAGHFAACAVSSSPLGVDIESARCTMALAERHFHPDELSYLNSLPAASQPDALLRLWTAKEAFLKALGRGLSLPLASFSVELEEKKATLHQTLSPLPFSLHEYLLDDARLCLCACAPRPEAIFIRPDFSPSFL